MSSPDSSKQTATTAATTNLSTSGLSSSQAQQLFGQGESALTPAIDYYKNLASGDPNKIFAAVAPAAQGVSSQFEQTKKNIQNSMPQGGEKNLALEQAEIAKGGQIGNLETQAYTGAFPALAQIAGSALGLSTNDISNAISAASGAGTTATNVMSANAAGKGATLGAFSGLASAGGSIGASEVGNKGINNLAAALA